MVYFLIGLMVVLGFYLSFDKEFEKETNWGHVKNFCFGITCWPMLVTFLLLEIYKNTTK
jgi:hypothetical protein